MTTKIKWAIGIVAVAAVAYFTKDKWMKPSSTTPAEPKKDETKSEASGTSDGYACKGKVRPSSTCSTGCSCTNVGGGYTCVACGGASIGSRYGKSGANISSQGAAKRSGRREAKVFIAN